MWCGVCLTFSEELSAWLFEWPAKRFSTGWRPTVKREPCEVGSSLWCCPGCCSFAHLGEELCLATSWSPESDSSRKAIGSHCNVSCADVAHSSVVRRRRHRGPDEESTRASRALSLVHMGELSAARQAMEGASAAPGNLATLGVLTDPTGRPPVPGGFSARRCSMRSLRNLSPSTHWNS